MSFKFYFANKSGQIVLAKEFAGGLEAIKYRDKVYPDLIVLCAVSVPGNELDI